MNKMGTIMGAVALTFIGGVGVAMDSGGMTPQGEPAGPTRVRHVVISAFKGWEPQPLPGLVPSGWKAARVGINVRLGDGAAWSAHQAEGASIP